MSQPEIAKLLWTKTDDPLRMAVYASLLCHKVAQGCQEGLEKTELVSATLQAMPPIPRPPPLARASSWRSGASHAGSGTALYAGSPGRGGGGRGPGRPLGSGAGRGGRGPPSSRTIVEPSDESAGAGNATPVPPNWVRTSRQSVTSARLHVTCLS